MKENTMLQNHDFKNTSFEKTTVSGNNDPKIPNPTLGTIRMVEETLSGLEEYPSRNKLWRSLPRQVQYPIFKEILKYLEESNKLLFDKDGKIVWTFGGPDMEKLREKSVSLITQ